MTVGFLSKDRLRSGSRSGPGLLLGMKKVPAVIRGLGSHLLCRVVLEALQVPAHKVKLFVGPGGEKIKWIQRKSKCRVQVPVQIDIAPNAAGAAPGHWSASARDVLGSCCTAEHEC